MKRLALAVFSAAVIGCSATPQQPEPTFETPDYSTPQHYGVDGELTTEEANYLDGLSYPQTYDDMKNTFGFPAERSSTSDIYEVEDGRRIEVFYDGTEATGHEIR